MSAEYPLLVLPAPANQDKSRRNGHNRPMHYPDLKTQGNRLQPKFERLVSVFENGHLHMQLAPDGLEPEYALVLEVATSLNSFFNAVKKIDGFEWLFDFDEENIPPDEYFFDEDNPDKTYTGRVYCIMSDRKAINQLRSLWNHYRNEPTFKFSYGYGAFKQLFDLLRDIRPWGPSDRFEETGILEAWRQDVELRYGSPSKFEAELFFRKDAEKRKASSNSVRAAVESMGGSVISECIIPEIGYHGMKLELRSDKIEELLGDQRDTLALSTCNAVMFYRPSGQIAVDNTSIDFEDKISEFSFNKLPQGAPIIGLLDGMPIENHASLNNRLIVDDPDDFGSRYPANIRKHGTAMASVIIHGDLRAQPISTISRPIYVRPVMRPDSFGKGETYPEDGLIVDIIHSAVKRMFEKEDNISPVAPTVRVINISLGDSSRQYLRTPSPLAKLLDWLSYKYRVLFIISAGNQTRPLNIGEDFSQFKISSLEERTALVGKALEKQRRNLRILSPAESINCLTVGATFEDNSSLVETSNAIQPIKDGKVSPLSSFGVGIGRCIKPEIVYPGGRFLVNSSGENSIECAASTREPGVCSASPSSSSISSSYSYGVGTSYSAALLSHESALNYEVLEDVFLHAGYSGVPDEYAALLLKAMAVHGVTYSSAFSSSTEILNVNNRNITQWVGYGKPNFNRVRECAENRVTAIGFGTIEKDGGRQFHIPLPLDFSSNDLTRRLVVTLAYFSPVLCLRNEYRQARLWFDRVGLTKERLVPTRSYTDYKAIQRGTLQHQSFKGSGRFAWDGDSDGIDIKVSCATTTSMPSLGKETIPYTLLITFETKENVNVYQPVSERIRPHVAIKPKS